jgi:predicted GH43/DUF377 family glycosyl hydrolase
MKNVFFLFFGLIICGNLDAQSKSWMLGPFERPANAAPIIAPNNNNDFFDPMTRKVVKWESMATFNPAAIVKDGAIHILYRAEEKLGDKEIGGHTSRLGLAVSLEGSTYTSENKPVFFPDHDDQREFEWTGGTEDPRVVEAPGGTFILTYTQWNRKFPRLAVATSNDLIHWKKHGPIFQKFKDGKYHNRETKSGAILTELKNGKLMAATIGGKYWMYFGVPHIWLASSKDLIQWEPVETIDGQLAAVLSPRPGYFDSWLVEAGPPPVLTDDGIVVMYNAGNQKHIGDPNFVNRMYTAGQALFDKDAPWKLLDRTDAPFLKPELSFEKSGQYPEGTTFVEGLAVFKNNWYLYYGTADSMIGYAVWKKE